MFLYFKHFGTKNMLFYSFFQISNLNALLFSGITVADCYSIVLKGVKVYGDAERRADFILSPIALANIAVVIKLDVQSASWRIFFQHGVNFFGSRDKFGFILKKWKNCRSYWGDIFRKFEICSRLSSKLIFGVSRDKNSQDRAVHTKSWFNTVGGKSFPRLFVKILEINTRGS